jgi:hypothetical protein
MPKNVPECTVFTSKNQKISGKGYRPFTDPTPLCGFRPLSYITKLLSSCHGLALGWELTADSRKGQLGLREYPYMRRTCMTKYGYSTYPVTYIFQHESTRLVEMADITRSIASILAATGFHVNLQTVLSRTVPLRFFR